MIWYIYDTVVYLSVILLVVRWHTLWIAEATTWQITAVLYEMDLQYASAKGCGLKLNELISFAS
jgi:hypothetical protein